MDPYLQAILGSDPAPYGGQMPDPRKALIEALQRRRFEEQQQAALVKGGTLDPMTAGENQTFNQPEAYEPGAWKRQLLVDAVNQFVPRVGDNEEQTMYKADNALLNIAGIPGTGAPGVLAAVKQPGGNWHPDTLTRLSSRLKDKLIQGANVAADHTAAIESVKKQLGERYGTLGNEDGLINAEYAKTPSGRSDAWTDKAVRNYLNKYAGTERDPLKNLEVPFGEGTRRWEEITDAVFRGTEARKMRETQAMQDSNFNTHSVYDWRDEPISPAFKTHDEALAWKREMAPGWTNESFLAKIPPEEKIWHDAMGHKTSKEVLEGFLGHTADYLRQNVKPEDLQRYDLTRAIRETVENDARVAKQMQNAAAAGLKELPTHKEYPDGMRWVELKLPERLTPTQAASVQQMSGGDLRNTARQIARQGDLDPQHVLQDMLHGDPHGMPGETFQKPVRFVALGPDGKPLKNNYTGAAAYGSSPEEAWLAGKLAEEGNQMGHCVGGYCEPVASGESRIFSLRGPDGKSHVTVEASPPHALGVHELKRRYQHQIDYQVLNEELKRRGYKDDHNNGSWYKPSSVLNQAIGRSRPKDLPDEEWVDVLRTTNPHVWTEYTNRPWDIQQIKGKQNRAPVQEYLPYVQDLVKSGNWGEVGDIGNAGLVDLQSRVRSDMHKNFIQKTFPNQRYVTEKELRDAVSKANEERGARGLPSTYHPGDL